MALSSNINIKVDPEDKEKASALFKQWGLTFSSAINVFLKQCINQGHMPFTIGKYEDNYTSSEMTPEEIDQLAEECEQIARDPNVKSYNSFSELLKEIDNEIENE